MVGLLMQKINTLESESTVRQVLEIQTKRASQFDL